ncbi:hypothetical protein BGZ95_009471, partial [Linnemannia exigua]
MATSRDRKGVTQSVPIPEEEQTTFGQQSPYASGFNDNNPTESSTYFPVNSSSIPSTPTAPSSSQPSTVTSPQQQHQQQIPRPATAPPPIPLAVPIEEDVHHYPDDQPPAYDEVARPVGAPQGYYGNSSNNQGYNGDSDDGSRRFNKFWLIFLAVVVLLSITVDDDKEVDNGSCGTEFTRPIYSHSVSIPVNNMEITADGIMTTVILEQREDPGEEPYSTLLTVFGTGRDRDDLKGILRGGNIDPTTGLVRIVISRGGDSPPSDCMSATIRVSIPPYVELIRGIKIIVNEGNVTLAMRQPRNSLQIKELHTRVMTGYTRIDANAGSLQLGGSVGMIEGNVVVGQSMTVLMVDGHVSLNVTQSTPTVDGKINVTNGNIDVGLMTPYEGTFRLETGSGLVDIHNVDFSKTNVKYESNKALKGWRSETGAEPRGRYSSLKLATHAGQIDLDMAPEASTTIAATPSTATAPIKAPLQPSPAAGLATAAKTEPDIEADAEEAGETDDKVAAAGLSFIDLVFDTILLEESTLHRSRLAPNPKNNTQPPILVPLFYTRLAQAFEIAQSVCHIYHEVHPRHRVSRLAEEELEEADLTSVERLKAYVGSIGGCNGYFLDDGVEVVGESVGIDDDAENCVLDQSEDGHQDGEDSDQQQQEREQGLEQDKSPHQQQEQHDVEEEEEEDGFVFVKVGIVFPPGRLTDSDSFSIPALNEIQIKDFNDRYGPVDPEYQDMVARVLFRLRKDYWNRTITTQDLDRTEPELLMPYGSRSYASGLGSESSDADLCITTEHFQHTASYNNVRTVAQVLRRGGMTQVQPITNARVPIVKFVDPTTKTNCDVNTNHVLGIHNSELIRCYTMIDDRVRPFLYSLKALVKKHGINDSSQAWLSSYAYVMMAIGFLQAQEPPVLPALQVQPESQMTELYVQMNHEGRGGRDVINCTFDRDPKRYANFGAANTKTVGQLLIEFFEYYSRFYDYQTMEVNVRCGEGIRVREDISKAAARKNGNPNTKPPQRGRGEKKLIVMDPFIRDRNVAGSCSGRHLVRVWSTFESLYLTLSRGDFKDAFERIEGYEDDDDEYVGGRRVRRGGLTAAQERMIASKQARTPATQAKLAVVRPRTPVQVQAQTQVKKVQPLAQAALKPQVQPAVTPAQTQSKSQVPSQAHGKGQGKAVNGSGATETHRPREKKTEGKLERKESRREKRELNKASSSRSNVPNSTTAMTTTTTAATTTTTAATATTTAASSTTVAVKAQQPIQEAIVVNAGNIGEGGSTATDGDDDDNDSQQGGGGGGVGLDGESKSRKRRQRRSVARNLHATTSTTGTATVVVTPMTPSPTQGGTHAEGAVAAAVFATAVARATNSANLKQSSTPAATLATPHAASSGPDNRNISFRQQPAGDQFALQLQQQQLKIQQQLLQQQQQKKLQKQQKQANKQLQRQQAKLQQQQQQQGQQQGLQQGLQQGQLQQVQQLNPQYPVLAKTHMLLLGKSKKTGNSGGDGGGGDGGRKSKGHAGA